MAGSFVDRSRYEGCCYQAANWIQVGPTKGRGRNGRRDAGKSGKDIYLYPLVENLPERLGIEHSPRGRLGRGQWLGCDRLGRTGIRGL